MDEDEYEYGKVYEYLLTGVYRIGYTKYDKKILRRKAMASFKFSGLKFGGFKRVLF